ncbi:uncharacterized protein TNCV_1789581 [Trichonephila clavipes]|nr:uncharacterized protein TNCV_1789581 [Trichonephila clavipes]
MAKIFLDSLLTVCPHKSLNSGRSVVSEPDLLSVLEAKILERHSDLGVPRVRRITIKKDAMRIPTIPLILTFNRPKLPSTIKAGYSNCKIRPYIPNPLPCFKFHSNARQIKYKSQLPIPISSSVTNGNNLNTTASSLSAENRSTVPLLNTTTSNSQYRTVACFVTGSGPVPLKTRRVGQRCTLNLSRAETSSRWCGVVVRRGGASSGVVHVT